MSFLLNSQAPGVSGKN